VVATSTHTTHTCEDSHLWTFQEYSIGSKTLTLLGSCGIQKILTLTLTLDDYQAMLNIGPLVKEGAPFLLYCYCSIVEKNIWEWDIEA